MAHPAKAIPLLKTRYHDSPTGSRKRKYAQILAILGDPTGAATLIAAVDAYDGWDQGVTLTSQRKTGNTFSDLDRLVIALVYSRAPEALTPLISKLEQLEPDSELPHYKAISLALRRHQPSNSAAKPLTKMLKQPGFTGHATVAAVARKDDRKGEQAAGVADRLVTTGGNESANDTNLNRAYKEIIIVAMLYRCGDRDGMAEAILKQYARDIHGHFARYARWILDSGPFASQRTEESPRSNRSGIRTAYDDGRAVRTTPTMPISSPFTALPISASRPWPTRRLIRGRWRRPQT